MKSSLQCTIFQRLVAPQRRLIDETGYEYSMASPEITLEAVSAASDIPAADWDACANPKADPNSLDNLDTLASPGGASDSSARSKSA